jgi:hypothetical protein
MSKRGKRLAIALIASLVAAAAVTTAVYAVTRGGSDTGIATGVSAAVPATSVNLTGCKTGKSEAITNDTGGLTTTSTTYVGIPGMSASVKAKGCIYVTLSGSPFAGSGEVMRARVLVDGVPMSPADIQMAADAGPYASGHSVTFAGSVSGGTHTVTAQFLSVFGATVSFNWPSMVIQHG